MPELHKRPVQPCFLACYFLNADTVRRLADRGLSTEHAMARKAWVEMRRFWIRVGRLTMGLATTVGSQSG